jgi:hypothetical protein
LADVGAADPGQQAARLFGLCVDQRQRRELDSEDRPDLVEQGSSRSLGIRRSRQRLRDCRDRLELPPTDRDELFSLACPSPGREQLATRPPANKDDHRRQERDQNRCEREPEMAADRLAVVEHHGAEECRRNPDAREDQRHGQVAGRHAGTVAPQPRRNGSADGQIGRGDRKERHRVEHNHLRLLVHWALGMIGAANGAVEKRRASRQVRNAQRTSLFQRWAGRPIGMDIPARYRACHWAMRTAGR